MAGENLLSAIELLEQHAAGEQMRPCHRAERQDRIGAAENGCIQPIRPANGKSEFRCAAIAPAGNAIGQSAARPRRTALVKGDQGNARRQRANQPLALSSF